MEGKIGWCERVPMTNQLIRNKIEGNADGLDDSDKNRPRLVVLIHLKQKAYPMESSEKQMHEMIMTLFVVLVIFL
jgi:hypothetical protein